MDYIDKIFNKHYRTLKFKRVMDLEAFREAVKDIEADHLKRVCETE